MVVVDNDPSNRQGLLLWEWLYDVEIEEEYRDSKPPDGGVGEQSTVMPEDRFVLHDGTDSIVVETSSFSEITRRPGNMVL